MMAAGSSGSGRMIPSAASASSSSAKAGGSFDFLQDTMRKNLDIATSGSGSSTGSGKPVNPFA
eukprot:gene19847-14438_t